MFKFIKSLMKSNKKPLLLSIFSLIGAFALLVVAVGSFAWYSSNKNTQTNGLSLTVGCDDVFANYNVYMKDDDGIVVSGLTLDDTIVIHTFDSVFTAKNQYNPVFVRITVVSASLYANSSASNDNLTFTIYRQNIAAADSVTSYYLTSVMEFAMAAEDPSVSYANDTAIYTANYSSFFQDYSNVDKTPVFKNAANAQAYVSGNTKASSLVFNVQYNQSSWRNNNGTYELNIILAINYSRDLMESGNFASSSLSSGLENIAINFASDLDKIVLEN